MKKSDLKDGMCLISKNGATAYVIGKYLYYKDDKCEVGKRLGRIDNLTDYTNDLKARVVPEYDIVKITYGNEVIWERKEYLTFEEAVATGKRFKHRDWFNFKYLHDALVILNGLCESVGEEEASARIGEKLWEVENIVVI